MRLASVVLAACAAAFAASDSSAADAPPKVDAAKPLRLALAKDKTYLYRLRETITVRHEVDAALAELLPIETRAEVVWDAGVSLQSVEANGDTIVSLMPSRVRGSTTEIHAQPEPFDSEDLKAPVTSPLLGRAIRVRLSPAGRVLEASGPDALSLAGAGPAVQAAL